MSGYLDQLVAWRVSGMPRGITSVCSAHPVVLRAALRHGAATSSMVLIEATCNQVNHLGGYTGMRPADFVALVERIAGDESCPMDRVILGGDHLGPNPWRDQSAETALVEAEKMVAAYVAAGFRKIHLDASMGCAGEPLALDDAATAARAVRLAAVAERIARDQGGDLPRYVIGTEVPPPGGADHALRDVPPTDPDAARKTIAVHRDCFNAAGLGDAFDRVIGIVVQPGVEFGNHNVVRYLRDKAQPLVRVLDGEDGLVFEAHSTDYQGTAPLSELVQDGFAILKVGPELTFVLREALYALDLIASDLVPGYGDRPLKTEMERIMLADPGQWDRHYAGDSAEQALLRHYSLSDRIRYYWVNDAARGAVERLIAALQGRSVPLPLFWQHWPAAAGFADAPLDPEALLIWRVTQSLCSYHAACNLKN
ncbi:MAG: class II D-tagatose-bisphosphate aldolase, non-catalytic subunit [Pseudotabrizicola sp.]|uniref:class II D-tagatose-bisphosphate aldolase, non-catalytic subunit n=1 Tax=Pseudotabrizicola sp. TaxID=2939647 RepID=UPI00272FB585|nr:class II D-tagatose-bisphosphate aldolase, non-catalytic subunit [Pseudotabrizicola sp.]MDP2083259.1 class II D-tagatose-bisphosphate aldolase, non-catalytic subunit [Pseudotabrizicola sp.]MDZ7575938.1 class II D-tagatose-bisphosphate aldolase, non-catalytic subunit [Pseudotabrizicola sp.]